MAGRCPLCGQSLPKAISNAKLEAGLQKLAMPALIAERKRLRDQHEAHLAAHREQARQRAEREVAERLRAANERARRAEQASERQSLRLKKEYFDRLAKESAGARREAQNSVRMQLLDAQKRAKDADNRSRRAVEQARKESNNLIRKEVAHALRISARENEEKLNKAQAERRKDKVRHEAERAKLQGQLDELSRKLDNQSGERLGTEAECDLLAELKNVFRGDDIKRVGRGVKGADLLHAVKHEGKIVGRIVYESKNTGNWNNSFILQAKKYRAQYETMHVMIVTRTFPDKQRGFCVRKGIPIVEARAAVALATIMREGIVRISELGVTGRSRDAKSHELFEYVISEKFSTRFHEIAEGISSLRERQEKERTWHENSWREEDKIHDRIQNRHREVEAEIRAIVMPASNGRPLRAPARAQEWPDEFGIARA